MWIIRLALKRPYTFVVAIFVISKGSACASHPPSHSFGAAGRDAATVALRIGSLSLCSTDLLTDVSN